MGNHLACANANEAFQKRLIDMELAVAIGQYKEEDEDEDEEVIEDEYSFQLTLNNPVKIKGNTIYGILIEYPPLENVLGEGKDEPSQPEYSILGEDGEIICNDDGKPSDTLQCDDDAELLKEILAIINHPQEPLVKAAKCE